MKVNFHYPPSFRCSSAVEQLTVNQLVAGSNPAAGASNKKAFPSGNAFLLLMLRARRVRGTLRTGFEARLRYFVTERRQNIQSGY